MRKQLKQSRRLREIARVLRRDNRHMQPDLDKLASVIAEYEAKNGKGKKAVAYQLTIEPDWKPVFSVKLSLHEDIAKAINVLGHVRAREPEYRYTLARA